MKIAEEIYDKDMMESLTRNCEIDHEILKMEGHLKYWGRLS